MDDRAKKRQEERLANQLRGNLRKRKAQLRVLKNESERIANDKAFREIARKTDDKDKSQ